MSVLRKLLMPAFLVVVWVLLNSSASAGQVVLGIFLAFALVWAAKSLRPLHARPKRVLVALRLMGVVALDILRSNIAVARIIWFPNQKVVSGFIDIPLDMRDPHGLAVLACVITYTPGSVWVELNPAGDLLHIHVLDLKDEAEWVDLVKNRYERHLMEIFE